MKNSPHLPLLFLLLILTNYSNSIAQQGPLKLDSLLTVFKKYKSVCDEPCISDSSKVNYYIQISTEYSYRNPDTAIILAKEALDLSEKIKWQMGVGQSYNQIGWSYYLKGEYTEALKYYFIAFESWAMQEENSIQEQIGFKKGNIATTLGNIGNVYKDLGDYVKALDYFFKALKMNEESGNKTEIAIQLGNIGRVYDEKNDFAKARSYYLKALRTFEETNDKNKIAYSLGNLGIIYSKEKKYEQALDYLLKALAMHRAIDNKNGIARWIGTIGTVFDEKKEYEKALPYYLEAVSLSAEIDDKRGIATWYTNIATLYTANKKYEKALKYAYKGLELSDNIGAIDLVGANHFALSEIYEKTGHFNQSLTQYKIAVAIRDSLSSDERTKEISKKEINYEEEKKGTILKAEKEKQNLIRKAVAGGATIFFLSSGIIIIFYRRKREAEMKQKESLMHLQLSESEMKALRSQMNPHFIFNALQSIQTFLLSHKSEEANTYLLKFSKLMRLVLENSQHSEVSLKEDLLALELYMQLESIRLPHRFTYEFHIDENINVEETTIPPLILQPCVENAIWHGLQYKPEPGHINIYISKIDNALHAIVEDNGVGRNVIRQVNQPMLLKKESLGMKLTEERLKILNEMKKIKAQFKITDLFASDNKPAGTKVELSLPLIE